ncbi:uncharacterized protein LOC125278722 [Megalobrama amblycephala]|uniref:uncharacterized protein LOC125278722 n=1 Tax=Megalobrama amblycephala TaxID=75352 RepID=UPI002013D7E6|nr:uncharacterized protein LOC125278722 [Megalobrama amblycephala]
MDNRESRERSSSPEPSCVSMKSDGSMDPPVKFSDETVTPDQLPTSQAQGPTWARRNHSSKRLRLGSSGADHSRPSYSTALDSTWVSSESIDALASIGSKDGKGGRVRNISRKTKRRRSSSCVSMKSDGSMDPPLKFSDETVTPDQLRVDGERSISRGAASDCLNNILRNVTASLNRHDQPINYELQRVKDRHKTSMKNKYERLFEGMKLQENETLLNRIYTQLYIIEGESEGVNEEHEVLQMEKTEFYPS